jgi:hypothetical protein
MADRVMLITWGENVAGREERGLEVFNEAIGFYGRAQQGGRIESFDVAICGPNATLDGYIVIRGSAEQLAALREDEEYMRNLMDASLVVQDLAVCEGFTGNDLAKQIGMYQQAVQKVPQHA